MGLEPTTFCMASASDVRASSRPCAQTLLLPAFPTGRANASELERTPNLAILATLSVWDREAFDRSSWLGSEVELLVDHRDAPGAGQPPCRSNDLASATRLGRR
jgi:hypothetical protein